MVSARGDRPAVRSRRGRRGRPGPGRECLVGRSPAMQEVYKAIGRVAPQDLAVLILGESGTGKELVARAVYQHGRGPGGRSWPSTAPRSPRSCWRASCSATRRGRSPGPTAGASASSSSATGGRCSWTRSATYAAGAGEDPPRAAGQVRAGRRQRDDPGRRAGHRRDQPRPEAQWWPRASSAGTSITAWASSRSRCRPFASGRRPAAAGGALPPAVRPGARAGGAWDRPGGAGLLRRYPWPGNIRELQSVLRQALLQARGRTLLPAFLPALPGEPMTVPPLEVRDPDLEAFIRLCLASR